MGRDTDIEWADSTANPTMGCDGCELWNANVQKCYAGVLHGRYGGTNKGFSPRFEILTEYPGRMMTAARWSDLRGTDRPDKPWFNGQPRHIFVSDMSDALSKAISFEYLKTEIIDVAASALGRRHIWMWLTKQAARMAEFSEWLKARGVAWPENLWPGTSVTTRGTCARIDHLLKVGDGDTTRFISAEPLLELIKLKGLTKGFCPVHDFHSGFCHGPCETDQRIGLVITGGESGSDARPTHPDWVRSLRDQCGSAGVPFFFKQWGAWAPVDQPHKQETVKPLAKNERWMNLGGGNGSHGDDVWRMRSVGKTAAGRLLDGREWNEVPIRAADGVSPGPRAQHSASSDAAA